MAVLDDLSGFEFEDLMEAVFRTPGYENARPATRTADFDPERMIHDVAHRSEVRRTTRGFG